MKITKKYMMCLAKMVFVFSLLIYTNTIFSQVGCKDPMANNYDAAAITNDGSCTYNPTSYSPPIKVDSLNAILVESSGLQMAGNFLWSFNDGGGAAAIYRIDTLSKAILQTVNLGGASNMDWEDIAFDGNNFYIGDFGNNAHGSRTNLKIYKFALGAIPDYNVNPTVTIPSNQIGIINFNYSDQLPPLADSVANHTKFDCEAMIIDNGQIHLFTKNWIDTNTTHYFISDTAAGSYSAIPLETLQTGYLVTAADKAPGQNLVALLGYQAGFPGKHYMHLLSDYSGVNYFNGNVRRIDLPDATVMGQAEGITFRTSTYGYISNEKLFTINQKLRSFDVSNFIPFYVLPLTLKTFTVNNINGTNKISWDFFSKVENVQVEYSSDGINFNPVKMYNNSITGIYYNKVTSSVNYYRISWQQNNGARQYSKIIRINVSQHSMSNVLLKANGQLSFLLKDNTPQEYSFKLVSSDGKILAQTKDQSYSPGINSINISKKYILNDFVFLTMYNNHQETTISLSVKR